MDVGPPSTSILLRKENSVTNQRALKEKFVVVYEALFNGTDPSAGNTNFWDEVLLLKVNASFLERMIILSSEDKLISLKGNISMIFTECTKAVAGDHQIRRHHALETMSVLMRSIFRKKFNDFGGDVTSILCGSMDRADTIFTDLLISVQRIIEQATNTNDNGELVNPPSTIVPDIIHLLLVIVSGLDNINQNTLFEYFLKVDLFPVFTKAIVDGQLPTDQSFKLILLIVILANYQKNEATNIYLHHLKHIENPVVLKAFTSVLSDIWPTVNREHAGMQDAAAGAGVWSKLGSYVSSFIYKQPEQEPSSGGLLGGLLLALYTLASLNPPFVRALVPPRKPEPSPATNVGVALIQQFLTFCTYVFADCTEPRTHTYAKLCLLILTCMSENTHLEDFFHDPASAGSFTYSKSTGPVDKSVVANAQPQSGQGLACVVLDALNLFMKQNIKKKFEPEMYKISIGVVHRILSYEKKTATRLSYKWKDMWNTLFLVMKQSMGASSEMGMLGVGNNVNSAPPAGNTAIQQPHLSKQQLAICMQVVTVLNLFITYGDSFLPSPSDYDDLYYEIMRVSKMLDQFYTIAERHEHGHSPARIATPATSSIPQSGSQPVSTPSESTLSEVATDVPPQPPTNVGSGTLATLSMLNIKTIITHFSGKIQQWNFAHPEVALTPDVVLRIIKDNYDSLKLKLQENLDSYEEYVETSETTFFRQVTRTVIQDLKISGL